MFRLLSGAGRRSGAGRGGCNIWNQQLRTLYTHRRRGAPKSRFDLGTTIEQSLGGEAKATAAAISASGSPRSTERTKSTTEKAGPTHVWPAFFLSAISRVRCVCAAGRDGAGLRDHPAGQAMPGERGFGDRHPAQPRIEKPGVEGIARAAGVAGDQHLRWRDHAGIG